MSRKKTKTEYQKYKSIFRKLDNQMEKESQERQKNGRRN